LHFFLFTEGEQVAIKPGFGGPAFGLEEAEYEDRHQCSFGHSHAYIEQEMLAQVDTRIASEQSQNEAEDCDKRLGGEVFVCVDKRAEREEDEERGCMAGGEGMPTVHVYLRNDNLLEISEQVGVRQAEFREERLRARHIEDMLDDLNHQRGSAFCDGKNGCPALLPDDEREKHQHIDGPVDEMGVVEEERVQSRRMIAIEEQVKLGFGNANQSRHHSKQDEQKGAQIERIIAEELFHIDNY